MTTPKVTEITRNGNPVSQRAVDRHSAPATTAAQNSA
jgi:hypothetical protein